MNITCEHCGSTIDIDKDKVCPNCGAPYSNNKEFKEVKEYHKKEKEINLKEKETNIESKQLANKMFKSSMKGGKIVGIVAGIIIIAVIVLIAFLAFKQTRQQKIIDPSLGGQHNEIENQLNNSEKEILDVSFNETAQTVNYAIKCNKVSEYNYDYFEKKEYKKSDNKVYNFQIVFQNKLDRTAVLDKINLTYTDNDGNEDVVAKKVHANVVEAKKSLDIFVNDTLTHKGNVSFEIPKYVKNVKLVYEKVTINIDNFKDHM